MIGPANSWKQLDHERWVLFSRDSIESAPKNKLGEEGEDTAKSKPDSMAKTKDQANNKESPFFFSSRKIDQKGTVVYTSKGFGILQATRPDNIIIVKVGQQIFEFPRDEVSYEITVDLMILYNNTTRISKALIPVSSTCRDVIEKIEQSFKDSNASMRVLFKGTEFSPSGESIEKAGIVQDSKFIVLTCLSKPSSVSRFTSSYNGWCYGPTSVDGISFRANKNIRVIGFGIYNSEKNETLSGSAKFVSGEDVNGSILYQRDVVVTKNEDAPDPKIYRFLFDKPISVKANDAYTCVVEIKAGNSHYGNNGIAEATGEGEIHFTFAAANGSTNGTGTGSGQIPEVYYYL